MKRLHSVAVLLMALITAACKRTEYVTVPEYHERVITRTDTLHIIDSVSERKTSILQEVDSAYLAKIGIISPPQKAYLLQVSNDKQEKNGLTRISHDTIIQRDTISRPCPIERRVEVNVLYRWQKLLIGIGITALLFILVWIARVLRRM